MVWREGVCLSVCPAVDLSSGNRFASGVWSGGWEFDSYWVLLPSTAIGSPLLIDINGLALMELGLHKATYW
jgi:hypothetical protein